MRRSAQGTSCWMFSACLSRKSCLVVQQSPRGEAMLRRLVTPPAPSATGALNRRRPSSRIASKSPAPAHAHGALVLLDLAGEPRSKPGGRRASPFSSRSAPWRRTSRELRRAPLSEFRHVAVEFILCIKRLLAVDRQHLDVKDQISVLGDDGRVALLAVPVVRRDF